MTLQQQEQQQPSADTRPQQAVIILRSEAPLPVFCTPFPLPPPDADVSLLRLSVLRILDGRKRQRAETLTHSEQIKQMTIQGWRLALLELKLVQAGARLPDGSTGDPVDTGLELRDDHKCSTLEHGDEVVVRLVGSHDVAELRLPDLGESHDYSVALDSPTEIYRPQKYNLSRPSEPSSYSSSIQANPMANYQAFQYPDYRNGYRVVTTANANGANRRATDFSDPHRLAALTSMARVNGAAGDEARALLAAENITMSLSPKEIRHKTETKDAQPTAVRRTKKRSKVKLPGSALRIGPGLQGPVGSPPTRHELCAEISGEIRAETRAVPREKAPTRPKYSLPDSSLIPSAAAARVGVAEPRIDLGADVPRVRELSTSPRSRSFATEEGRGTPSAASRKDSSRALVKNVYDPKTHAKLSSYVNRGQHSGTARLFMPLYAPGAVLPSDSSAEPRKTKRKEKKAPVPEVEKTPVSAKSSSKQGKTSAIRMLFTSSMRSVADSVGPSAKVEARAQSSDHDEAPEGPEQRPAQAAEPVQPVPQPAAAAQQAPPAPPVPPAKPQQAAALSQLGPVAQRPSAAPAAPSAPAAPAAAAAPTTPVSPQLNRTAIMSAKHSLAGAKHAQRQSVSESARPVSMLPTYEAPAPPYEAPDHSAAQESTAPPPAGGQAAPAASPSSAPPSSVVSPVQSAPLPAPPAVPTSPTSLPSASPNPTAPVRSASEPPAASNQAGSAAAPLDQEDPLRRIEQVRAAQSGGTYIPRIPSNQLPIYMAHRSVSAQEDVERPLQRTSRAPESAATQEAPAARPKPVRHASLDSLVDQPVRHVLPWNMVSGITLPNTHPLTTYVGIPHELGAAGRIYETPLELHMRSDAALVHAAAGDGSVPTGPVQVVHVPVAVHPGTLPLAPGDLPRVLPAEYVPVSVIPQGAHPSLARRMPTSTEHFSPAVIPKFKDGVPRLSFSKSRVDSGLSIPSISRTSVSPPAEEPEAQQNPQQEQEQPAPSAQPASSQHTPVQPAPAQPAPSAQPAPAQPTPAQPKSERPQFESAFTENLSDLHSPEDNAEPAAAVNRADARYIEVQRELAAERARQDRAEKHRAERRERRRRRNEPNSDKSTRDLEREWAAYEEMIQRQREAGLPPPNIIGNP
ncbi:hypothetical protein MCUN1_002116 [Malassezia cuniculi]|uniref:Uncharacterized protein n=1 Tax=Malassezia cuniculi TaxID=948313 RepID=A0AAF0J6P1_9BASI|nr:hypothetical protein MCUN1_002116 [Malassezia cuniculi]